MKVHFQGNRWKKKKSQSNRKKVDYFKRKNIVNIEVLLVGIKISTRIEKKGLSKVKKVNQNVIKVDFLRVKQKSIRNASSRKAHKRRALKVNLNPVEEGKVDMTIATTQASLGRKGELW